MVTMKPVPVPQANNSSSKKFRIQGTHLNNCVETSVERPLRINNPFKRLTDKEKEQEKSLYSNIWEDDVVNTNSQKVNLDFYEADNPSAHDPHVSENALELTNNVKEVSHSEGLRDKTDRLFKIANNVKSPKFVDWKNSRIHYQVKDGTLTDYNNQQELKFYKESDIGIGF